MDVQFVVDEDGRVVSGSAVTLAATHPTFGEATLRAVERMRLRPGRINGQPVAVLVTTPIAWTITH